jgi:hypothetical protein
MNIQIGRGYRPVAMVAKKETKPATVTATERTAIEIRWGRTSSHLTSGRKREYRSCLPVSKSTGY